MEIPDDKPTGSMLLFVVIVHILWECSAYSSSRASFLLKLEELLGDRYADFEALNSRRLMY